MSTAGRRRDPTDDRSVRTARTRPPRRRPLADARSPAGSRLVVWVLLLVPLLVELAWVFWPAFNSFQLSFTRWSGVGVAEPVGLKNYQTLLADPIFRTAIQQQRDLDRRLRRPVRAHRPRARRGPQPAAARASASTAARSTCRWSSRWPSPACSGGCCTSPTAPINAVLAAVGIDTGQHQWLADPNTALAAILVAAIWRQAGYIMVLYLAGLKGCDPTPRGGRRPSTGPAWWQRFRYIVFPQLRNVNTVIFAVIVIDSLRTFDIVWAMTRGGPYNSTQLLSTYMYQSGFTQVNLGYGSAIAVVIFLLAIAFIITYLVRATREE